MWLSAFKVNHLSGFVKEILTMWDLESAVFVEILQDAGVLDWLQDTLGMDGQEVVDRADRDFEGLLAELQRAVG